MEKIKNLTRALLFLLILGLVSTLAYNTLSWKDSKGIKGLYACPRNSTDVLFIGSSHSFCTINTAILWEDYGIAANDISDGGQTFVNEYYYLKEALQRQRPKVVFAELRGIDLPYSISNGNLYRNTLNMKWSADFFRNANAAFEDLSESAAKASNLDAIKRGIYLKFPVIHTRYSELTKRDFEQDTLLRFQPNWSRHSCSVPAALSDTGKAELTVKQRQTLDQMISLSKEYGFELVLWVAPYVVNQQLMQEYNAIEQYAAENGVTCYNIPEVIAGSGVDYSQDMRDEENLGSHLNVYGSEKVTRYFGSVIKSDYALPDRRNDPEYDWYARAAREWSVTRASRAMDEARNLQDFVSALDHSLFEATVIDFGNDDIEAESTDDMGDSQTESANLINNAESFADWYVAKPKYTSYPEPGVIKLSASGLTDFAYARVEGPVSLETSDFMNGSYYVLSFEVMSPDWSAVSEPTTGRTGLDAVAVVFATSDEMPATSTMGYRFYRLGKESSYFWREVPEPVDGQWLKFVSVPIRFTSADEAWSYINDGLGKYLRVGPQLRANGTVSFRNIRLEKCDTSNGWNATKRFIIESINDHESDIEGLHTNGTHNAINGVWELSDSLKLLIDEDDFGQIKLYNGSNQVQIKKCDVCVIVADKESGELIKKSEFTLSKGVFTKS